MNFTSENLQDWLGVEITPSLFFKECASLEKATSESLSFFQKGFSAKKLNESEAKAILVTTDVVTDYQGKAHLIVVEDSFASIIKVKQEFQKLHQNAEPFIHPKAKVHPSAVIEGHVEAGSQIGAHVFVGAQSFIGHGAVIHSGVQIYANVEIGSESVIHSNSVIGSRGFGFYADLQGNMQSIPHFGGVKIGTNCEIGPGCVVAAGFLHPTVLANQVYLDSMVQVAHNVEIGSHCYLAAHVDLAGSCRLGQGVQIGGGAQVANGVYVGDACTILASTGVTKDLKPKSKVAGFPAMDYKSWSAYQRSIRKQYSQ